MQKSHAQVGRRSGVSQAQVRRWSGPLKTPGSPETLASRDLRGFNSCHVSDFTAEDLAPHMSPTYNDPEIAPGATPERAAADAVFDVLRPARVTTPVVCGRQSRTVRA